MTEVTREEKVAFIRERLKEDACATDLQLSLFLAAQSSYRYDSVLRPFPPMYEGATPDDKDYRMLEKVTNFLPCLRDLSPDLDPQALDLLYWVLNPKHFTLASCRTDKFDVIQALTGQTVPTPSPTHIFEVVPTAAAEARFEEKRAGRETMYAYHGSRVENFHSILHYGLQAHRNKNSLFGEGTYLSAELSVSMPYAPTGGSWEKSCLGQRLSLIAVCEIINDKSVKCQVKGEENGSKPTRSRASNSLGGEVPEKYYVVQNNDMLRVKYVLVYADDSKPIRSRQPSWAYRHRFALMLIFYSLLLLVIGLLNSRNFQYQLKRWLR